MSNYGTNYSNELPVIPLVVTSAETVMPVRGTGKTSNFTVEIQFTKYRYVHREYGTSDEICTNAAGNIRCLRRGEAKGTFCIVSG